MLAFYDYSITALFSLPALPALYPFRAQAIFFFTSSLLALESLFIPSTFFFFLFFPPNFVLLLVIFLRSSHFTTSSDVLSSCWFSVISLPCRLRVTTHPSCLPLQSPTTSLLALLVHRKSIDGLSGGPRLRSPLVASAMPSKAMLLRLHPPMRRQPCRRMRIPC